MQAPKKPIPFAGKAKAQLLPAKPNREAQRRGGHQTAALQHARAHQKKSGY